jgi:non-heme chloroperoxidase
MATPESNHDVNLSQGLCASCVHAQRIESSKGSTFVLCRLSYTDARFARYPRLPVLACDGYVPESLDREKKRMIDSSAVRFANIRVATGPRLHYAEHGDSDGEPVVFLHGWPDSWFSFSRVLPLLPRSLRAIAVDQRGFGDSDRPESGYSIPEFAGDAIAFLDALDIERAALVGHSFGSFVARQAAIAQPQRVSALILIGTGLSTTTPATSELQTALQSLPDPIPEAFAREFQASTAYRTLPPEFFERIVAESLKLPPRLWRFAIDRLLEYDDAEQLARIEAPTLLLWGEHDALFSRSAQDRFMTALPAARLTIFQDTGHCPNWERPERVAADIHNFLRAVPKLRTEA